MQRPLEVMADVLAKQTEGVYQLVDAMNKNTEVLKKVQEEMCTPMADLDMITDVNIPNAEIDELAMLRMQMDFVLNRIRVKTRKNQDVVKDAAEKAAENYIHDAYTTAKFNAKTIKKLQGIMDNEVANIEKERRSYIKILDKLVKRTERFEADIEPKAAKLHTEISKLVDKVVAGFKPMDDKIKAVINMCKSRIQNLNFEFDTTPKGNMEPTATGRNVR